MYGVICNINGITITTGTPTKINGYGSEPIKIITLNENKVFIIFGSDYFYGQVCTINGAVITAGTVTQLTNYIQDYDIVSLSENKIFISYIKGVSTAYLYGQICTISGTSINVNTPVRLDNTISMSASTGYNVSMSKLSETKVFINFYHNALICTIEDTTLIAGSPIQLPNIRKTKVITLSENKVIIINIYSSTYLYGLICTIYENTITVGTNIQLTTIYGMNSFSAVLLAPNTVFIEYVSQWGGHLYKAICTISDMNIIAGANDILSDAFHSLADSVLVDINKICITHTYNNLYTVYGKVLHIQAGKSNSMLDTFGIAKTSGTENQIIQVFKPN